MKKPNYIIITVSTQESIDLHNHVGQLEFEAALKRPANQYPTDWKFYDHQWFWWFDNNDKLVGVGGQHAVETAVKNNPGAQIFTLEDFLKTYPKKVVEKSYKRKIIVHCGESVQDKCGKQLHPMVELRNAEALVKSDEKLTVTYSNCSDFIMGVKYIGKKEGVETEFFLNGVSHGSDIEPIFEDLNRSFDLLNELGETED